MRFSLFVASLSPFLFFVPACVGDPPSDTSSDGGGGGDGSVASCASPGAPTCVHGKCDDSTGTAKCACDPGFSGADCAEACDGGSCSSTVCGSITCGAHQVCDDSTGTPVCKCAVGYAGTTTCTWQSVPLDPGFQDTPPNSWTLTGGPVLEPSATGSVEPGDVHFSQAAICSTSNGTSTGRVTQTIQMPSYSVAEPLALNMTASVTCSDPNGPCDANYGIGAALNGGYSLLASSAGETPTYSRYFLCLGERAYGGPLSVVFSADGYHCSAETYDGLIDHADIEPKAECPLPGVVTNADFEAANGWSLTSGGGVAEFKAGCGVSSSACGHIYADANSQTPQIAQLMSVPGDLSQPNAAIEISYTGTTGTPTAALQVTLDNQEIGELVSNTGSQVGHLCVPDWAKGVVRTIGFQADARSDASGYTPMRDFAIDDFKWVTDPTCAASVLISDPGFERTNPARGWVLQAYLAGTTPAISEITNDATAHGGTRSLHMAIATCSETATASTTFTVPTSTATAGPALTFYFKAPSSTKAELDYQFDDNASDATGNQAGTTITGGSPSTWTKKTVCIDPGLAGRGQFVVFRALYSVSCTGTFTSDMYIDDVVPTTDASCPH